MYACLKKLISFKQLFSVNLYFLFVPVRVLEENIGLFHGSGCLAAINCARVVFLLAEGFGGGELIGSGWFEEGAPVGMFVVLASGSLTKS